MIDGVELFIRTQGYVPLVRNREEEVELVRRLVDAYGANLLAYCPMKTHLHALVLGSVEDSAARLRDLSTLYESWSNGRREPVDAIPPTTVRTFPQKTPEELARTIHYIHMNPCHKPRLVPDPVDYAGSSARAFASFTAATHPNVHRATQLIGRVELKKIQLTTPSLAGLERAPYPCASPGLIVAAVAEAFDLSPRALWGDGLTPEIVAARRAAIRLASLESYTHAQLAPFLGRTRSRLTQLAQEPVADQAVRIARTLLRESRFRNRLEPFNPEPITREVKAEP